MSRMVPAEKMSKRQKRLLSALRRGSWNGVNPVTRVVPDRKRYSRLRTRQELRRNTDPY